MKTRCRAVSALGGVLALLATLPNARAVSPPSSLSGMVFHGIQMAVNTKPVENSVQLNADGTFSIIRLSLGLAIGGGTPPFLLQDPPANGTYTYSVDANQNATLTLRNSAGYSYAAQLVFTTPTAGNVVSEETEPFYLTTIGQFTTAPLLNISMRGTTSQGHSLSAGFVVPGVDPREFLIRAVGPGLAPFGITSYWATPTFQLYAGAQLANAPDQAYQGWSTSVAGTSPTSALQKVFALVGAFPVAVGSSDAAEIVRLPPGDYSIVCQTTSASDPGGDVLIELYALP